MSRYVQDTDKATRFCAVLDLTHHADVEMRGEGGEWRKRLQGPAIVFYDNGGFKDQDWDSLQNIYDSVKRSSPSQVGKYGMGSRSFFHIGDIMQIVSGSKYAILDPDERVSAPKQFGDQVDFVSDSFGDEGRCFRDAYPDECAPFLGLFGCTMKEPLKGTIIRVAQLHESTLCPDLATNLPGFLY